MEAGSLQCRLRREARLSKEAWMDIKRRDLMKVAPMGHRRLLRPDTRMRMLARGAGEEVTG